VKRPDDETNLPARSRNTDQLEFASDLQEELNKKGLAEVREALKQVEQHRDFDGKHCIDCDDEIHSERLAAGRIRCTSCQSNVERRSKLVR
jgi:RNA polymerase-binding transcription factor DksA